MTRKGEIILTRMKRCLATTLCLICMASQVRSEDSIPVGPSFDYHPAQYVVIDRETGLAWPAGEALLPPPRGTFNEVTTTGIRDFETTKYAAGHTGWRLPTIAELRDARDHGLYAALVEVARLEGYPYPRPVVRYGYFGAWASDPIVKNRRPWVNLLAPLPYEIRWWPLNWASGPYLPVRETAQPTPILWADDIQEGERPWGFSGLSTQYDGKTVEPDDANGANISRVPDPAGGPGFAMRHFAIFGPRVGRSQAGLWSFRNAEFAKQAKSEEGVYLAQEWYFPEALSAGGQARPWLSVWDWHSIGPNGKNRWHTSPGMFLAKDGSMRFRLDWNYGMTGNPTTPWSTIPLPVGRWFDVEMYYKWTTGPTTIKIWIDGELALEQTVSRTRHPDHNVVETYMKFYGAAPSTTPWSPTPSIKYTRNVRIAADRIWPGGGD
ncbi:heparin lyase I family protein [Tautonia marina]|uniref:heparin lyase I family protein n=1 Tax=Tautonia marina TaxID=2653855 RepID=UPI00126134B7|nr:heparin lyase I family protein [Tautonia marina]